MIFSTQLNRTQPLDTSDHSVFSIFICFTSSHHRPLITGTVIRHSDADWDGFRSVFADIPKEIFTSDSTAAVKGLSKWILVGIESDSQKVRLNFILVLKALIRYQKS